MVWSRAKGLGGEAHTYNLEYFRLRNTCLGTCGMVDVCEIPYQVLHRSAC